MNWGNAVTQLAESFRERLLWRQAGEISREWDLIQEERLKQRTRIARELRDTLLQGFFSPSMQLSLADDGLPTDSPAQLLQRSALDLVREAINKGRATLLGLRSPVLPDGSLEKSLRDVRDDLAPSERGRFRIVIVGETKPLEPAVQEQMFLIAREAILNALRHSEATSVEVEVEYLHGKLRVVVRDNGKGIDLHALQSGQNSPWALTGMQERAASIGAEIRVGSNQRKGTEVGISVPIRGV